VSRGRAPSPDDARLLRLTHADASVVLRLELDPEASLPALSHGAGCAFSYRGAELPEPLRDLVFELAATLETPTQETSTSEVAPLDRIEERLRTELRRLRPSASIERFVDVSEEVPCAPRWPASVRCGEPAPGSLWPFDAELAGLRLGLRTVLKREPNDATEAAADHAWLEGQGLTLAEMESRHGDSIVLFAAHDHAGVAQALAAERRLRELDDASAVDAMGALLGYPACCRAAVAGLTLRDDESLFRALLPGPGAQAASALSNWLGPLALISHACCSLTCAPTLRIGAALLGEIERAHTGFRSRWLELSARIHVVTPEGLWLLRVHSDDEVWSVLEAHILLPRAQPLVERPSVVGANIRSRQELASLLGAPVLAVADHRAGMR